MYDGALGRFMSIDPHAYNYEITTPYNYAFNNPLLFVDPTGKDNTIYLLLAGDYDKKEAEAIVNAVNKIFEDFKLETRYQIFDEKANGDFDASNLDETDNWAVIGTDRAAVRDKAKKIDPSWSKGLDSWFNYNGSDGRSKKDAKMGIVIHQRPSLNTLEGKITETERSAISLAHEAGHSSNYIRTKAKRTNSQDPHHLNDGIMISGSRQEERIRRGRASELTQRLGNRHYIIGMLERYHTKTGRKDNYERNKSSKNKPK